MENILQALQQRISSAENRVNEASLALQAADKAYSDAVNELHVWRAALDAEKRKQHGCQGVFVGMEELIVADPGQPDTANLNRVVTAQAITASTNKTELIRALLRENPAGLTPPQIWERVSDQFKHRPYMYSVLKRLKDHDEVVTRRNKYMLRPSQEGNQSLTVQ